MGVLNDLMHIVSIWYMRSSLVLYVTEDLDAGKVKVVHQAGAEWTKIGISAGKGTYTERKETDGQAGDFYKGEFTGIVPVKNAASKAAVEALCREPIVVKMELPSGVILVSGSAVNPIKMRYTLNTVEHEYALRFEHQHINGALELE